MSREKVMTSVSAHMDDVTEDVEEERGANKGSVSQSVRRSRSEEEDDDSLFMSRKLLRWIRY